MNVVMLAVLGVVAMGAMSAPAADVSPAGAAADRAPQGLQPVDVFVGDAQAEKKGREEGYHTFRIPALVQAKNGDLLAICEGRRDSEKDNGKIDLVLKRSTDGGKSWGKLSVIHGEEGNITIGNPVPIVDPASGAIHLVLCRNNRYGVFVTQSRDNGLTWEAPRPLPLAAPPKGYKPAEPMNFAVLSKLFGVDVQTFGTGPGHGLVLADGRMLCPIWLRGKPAEKHPGAKLDREALKAEGVQVVSTHDPGAQYQAGVLISDDGGKTWKAGGISGEGTNESTLAELADGTVLINSRFEPGGTYRIIARSKDRGETFTGCTPDRTLIDIKCEGSITRWLAPGGKDYLAFVNPAVKGIGFNRRDRLTLRLSADGGKTWPVAHEIDPGHAAYSDVAPLAGGALGVLYERGAATYHDRIAFVRLSPGWLLAGESSRP